MCYKILIKPLREWIFQEYSFFATQLLHVIVCFFMRRPAHGILLLTQHTGCAAGRGEKLPLLDYTGKGVSA